MIAEYVVEYVKEAHGSPFSAINTVENLLRNPGFSTDGSQHRVLYWHKNRRVAKVSKAMHILSPKERMLLIVHFNGVINEDGSTFTEKDLVQNSSLTTRRIKDYVRVAKRKVEQFLRTKKNYQ